MTEEEWLRSTNAQKMTAFLPQPISRRKCMLAVCGYGRRIESAIPLAEVVADLHLAEESADGHAAFDTSWEQFQSMIVALVQPRFAMNTPQNSICHALLWCLRTAATEKPYIGYGTFQRIVSSLIQLSRPDPKRFDWSSGQHSAKWHHSYDEELQVQMDIVRDVFGNPFRPASVDPQWLTSDVVALAKGIYEERAFDRMPILADALQDAGCDNDEVLNHCRGDSPHVRGCWVVDLVMGKS